VSWTIVPLDLGVLRDRPKDSITFGVGAGERVDLVCLGWLLLDGGAPILVDTGPGTPEHADGVHGVRLQRSAHADLPAALAAHDVRADDVRTVVMTHLHWDHCHGSSLLPRARFVVQDRELRYGVYPAEQDRRVYEFTRGAPFLADLPRMDAVDGPAEVAPGVTVIATPGHSPGHQSVLVETASGPYLIAGDMIDLYENWTDRVPSGPTVDVDAWERSYDELTALDAEVLPGHDVAVLERGPIR
jgi:glyoxylase-like metal-dependent hydrolase (beta-lactamase superfamily II)